MRWGGCTSAFLRTDWSDCLRGFPSSEACAARTAVLGVALFYVALTTAAETRGQELPTGSVALSKGENFEEHGGAALFMSVCAACHQPDGKGARGAASYPSLAEDKRLASAQFVERLLFEGRGAMPPVGRMMSDQAAADVINFVRTHFGNAYRNEVSASDVKAARPGKQP